MFFFTTIPTIVLSFHSNQIAHFCLGIINVTYGPMIHSFDLNQSHQNLSFLIYSYQFLLNIQILRINNDGLVSKDRGHGLRLEVSRDRGSDSVCYFHHMHDS